MPYGIIKSDKWEFHRSKCNSCWLSVEKIQIPVKNMNKKMKEPLETPLMIFWNKKVKKSYNMLNWYSS